MPKAKATKKEDSSKVYRTPTTPEAQENLMISLAMDLVRRRLVEGTASSQETTHFLKLAATREKDRLEKEILEKQKELMDAKTENLKSAKRAEELCAQALSAMKTYSGQTDDEEVLYDEY